MTIIFQIIYKTVNIKNLCFQQKVGRMIPYPSESVAPYHKWQPCNSLNLYNFEYKNCFSSVVKGVLYALNMIGLKPYHRKYSHTVASK